MKKLLAIPYTFTVLNWAAVAGLYHFLKNRRRPQEVWLRLQPGVQPGKQPVM